MYMHLVTSGTSLNGRLGIDMLAQRPKSKTPGFFQRRLWAILLHDLGCLVAAGARASPFQITLNHCSRTSTLLHQPLLNTGQRKHTHKHTHISGLHAREGTDWHCRDKRERGSNTSKLRQRKRERERARGSEWGSENVSVCEGESEGEHGEGESEGMWERGS